MNVETNPRILGSFPREKAFYFFTSIGNYTGMSASSLKEFVERVNEINVKSLEFHLPRGDFEKWINEVLQDAELATEIRKLARFNPSGDALRNQLSTLVCERFKRLTGQLDPAQF